MDEDAKNEDGHKVNAASVCPACGSRAQRDNARFCATCGRRLSDEGYRPADAVRASYHLQRRRVPTSSGSSKIRSTQNNRARKSRAPLVNRNPASVMLMTTHNSAAATALAFLTFSLVPYLGVLFCPGAIVMGVAGLRTFSRMPERGGQSASVFSIAAGVVVCGVHIFLWWILYFIYSANRT